jgi:hypothetical protein
MKTTLSILAAAALFAWPALAQAQANRPATAADLAGKTVCWDDGWRITYAKGGRYLGARGDAPPANHHNERWAISEPGVVQIDREGVQRYLQIVVLPDGRFERDRFREVYAPELGIDLPLSDCLACLMPTAFRISLAAFVSPVLPAIAPPSKGRSWPKKIKQTCSSRRPSPGRSAWPRDGWRIVSGRRLSCRAVCGSRRSAAC